MHASQSMQHLCLVAWQVWQQLPAGRGNLTGMVVQVMNFSTAELDILQRHTEAALETDEDWNQDNFS